VTSRSASLDPILLAVVNGSWPDLINHQGSTINVRRSAMVFAKWQTFYFTGGKDLPEFTAASVFRTRPHTPVKRRLRGRGRKEF